jgi:hypothetical protein
VRLYKREVNGQQRKCFRQKVVCPNPKKCPQPQPQTPVAAQTFSFDAIGLTQKWMTDTNV